MYFEACETVPYAIYTIVMANFDDPDLILI